jgi:hypothetical protein
VGAHAEASVIGLLQADIAKGTAISDITISASTIGVTAGDIVQLGYGDTAQYFVISDTDNSGATELDFVVPVVASRTYKSGEPLLLTYPDTGGGTDATKALNTDNFVTWATDADLTNAIVIPGLAGSPDVKAGGTNDEEFDVDLSAWTSFGTHVTENANTFAKSMYYQKKAGSNGAGDLLAGITKAEPNTTGWTMLAKLNAGTFSADSARAGIIVFDASKASPLTAACVAQGLEMIHNGGHNKYTVTNYTAGSGAGSGSTDIDIGGFPIVPPSYLKIVAHFAANVITTIDFLASWDGYFFQSVLAADATLVGKTLKVGVYQNTNTAGATNQECLFDWVRFS